VIADARARLAAGALELVADLQVESGWIGLGCMDTTLAFVGKEIIIPAGARHEVVVPIDDVGAASCLMIRNANDLNQPSRVRVYAIKLLDASATMLPSPLNVPGGLPVSPLVGLTP